MFINLFSEDKEDIIALKSSHADKKSLKTTSKMAKARWRRIPTGKKNRNRKRFFFSSKPLTKKSALVQASHDLHHSFNR